MSIQSTNINPAMKSAFTAQLDAYAINKKNNEALQLGSRVGNAALVSGSLAMIAGGIALAILSASTMGIALGVIVALAGVLAVYKKTIPDAQATWDAVDLTAGQDKIINDAINVLANPAQHMNTAPAAPAFAQFYNNNNNPFNNASAPAASNNADW